MDREYFEIRNGRLLFDGCDLLQLAKEYGTPVYIYSQNVITDRIREMKAAFSEGHPQNRIAYASKAFACKAMFKLMEKEGVCIDVVSGGELYTAVKAGFPAERIEFNGNNKSQAEIDLAVEHGIGRIIIDSLLELEMIEKAAAKKGRVMNVLFRITPGVKADTHDYVVTGKKDSKFGIPLDDDRILPYVKMAVESKWVNVLGLHFHIGSQIFENTAFLAAMDAAFAVADKIHEYCGYWIEELNIGGGFGARYTGEQKKPFSFFLDPMIRKAEQFASERGIKVPALVTEPGRSFSAEAGITLYTIGSIKEVRGIRTYAAIDGGMFENIRPALYGAKYEAVSVSKPELPADKTVSICGKCCESGDMIIKDALLADPQPGDVIAVLSTGAYGYSMASNYNRNPVPGVLFVKDGKAEWAVKPQTYEDIAALDLIPESLR